MNRRERAASAGIIGLCVMLGFVLGGCISSRSNVTYGPKGPAVGAETLRNIEVGVTSK